MRLFYRARQFWHALRARPDQKLLEKAFTLLTPAQMSLFRQMLPGEQAHALKVLSKLLGQGETHPDLLVAALLHDCGKLTYPMNVVERVWIVIAQRSFPLRSRQWGMVSQEDLPRIPAWRRALAVAEKHPVWGAELVRQAGGSALLQALIRRHQERPGQGQLGLEDELLYKLQVVDNES